MWFRALLITIDTLVITLSAVLVRYANLDFNMSLAQLASIGTYVVICAVTAPPLAILFGLDRSIWRLGALSDYLDVIKTVAVTMIVATTMDFMVERLGGVPRSLPLLQALLAVAAMIGMRVVFRSLHRISRSRKQSRVVEPGAAVDSTEKVLLVGVNREAELYAQFARELGLDRIEVVGAVGETEHHVGFSFSGLKVLGTIDDVDGVLRTLKVHGIVVDHIVVTTHRAGLTERASAILAEIDEAGTIRVDYFHELLFPGLARSQGPAAAARAPSPSSLSTDIEAIRSRPFWAFKRFVDIVGSLVLIVLSAPFFVLVAILVAVDIGLPLTFWQRRPGRFGRPFHLMKFRTMRGAHDADGNRLPDEQRTSGIGAFLRKTRLDELPQLLHILVGEMSFIGPRPLLPVDLPSNPTLRLMVRPGLTGWAQVQGGRTVSAEDKAILDEWYVYNASFKLDLKILLLTIPMVLFEENYNVDEIARARSELAARTSPSMLAD